MELVDRFDNKRRPIPGSIERYNEQEGEYTQVVHLWIQNSKKEFLFQKRSMKKRIYPGRWSVTGGASDEGETTLDALKRECSEEIGLNFDLDDVKLMMSIRRPKVFIDIFYMSKDLDLSKLKLQEDEVDELKWMSEEKVRELIKEDLVGNSTKMYFDLLLKLIEEQ